LRIEKDPRCVAALSQLSQHLRERFTLIEADALSLSPASLCNAPRAILANLPYNIGTELVTRWLCEIYHNATSYRSITVMLQKEVAERLTASVGSESYGRLSVLTQSICTAYGVMEVPAGAFSPPPKVTSTVVHICTQTTRIF